MSDVLALLTRTNKALRATADAAMRRHGLRLGQNLVLEALWEKDGRTPGELAEYLNVTTPTVVKMATRMSTNGLLTRSRDDTDNRLVRLCLTAKGRALRDPVMAEVDGLRRALTAGLTDRECRDLATTLEKVLRNLIPLGAGPHDYSDQV
ncbi:MAG: MarR family transcriptional regulator [Kutzneria sp.]|nr:MarR family transcriptional regulator [Kutzneria sp.]